MLAPTEQENELTIDSQFKKIKVYSMITDHTFYLNNFNRKSQNGGNIEHTIVSHKITISKESIFRDLASAKITEILN